MSSFVIGLDIGRSHVTATLIRIDSSLNQKLIIEHDQFYIRSFEENIKNNNPHLIISNSIDCIDDLLKNFINYYQEDDIIIGIACGISYLMNYEQGICHIQSLKSNENNQLFGLNLRLLFQSYLRNLIHRQKHYYYYSKYSTSPHASLSYLKQPTRSICHSIFNIPIISTINHEKIHHSKLSIKNLIDYCGLQEIEEITSYNRTFINSTEIISPITINNSSLKFQSMINQLSNIPISFFNDTICFAIGQTNNIYHKNYQRIFVLKLGINFSSVFIDQNKTHHTISSNDYFSIHSLINIYKKLIQKETTISNGYSLTLQALNGDKNAIEAYQIYARRLGIFLIPYIEKYHPNLLVIGGGIAQAWYLIKNELYQIFKKFQHLEIYFDLFNEKSICLGAIQQQLSNLFKNQTKILRHTDQYLLPVIQLNNNQLYSNYKIPRGYIGIGHKQLNEKLFYLIKKNNILLIDGFIGTNFNEFAEKLNEYYFQKNFSSLHFYDTKIFLKFNKIFKQQKKINLSLSIFNQLKTYLIDLNKLNYLKNNLLYPCVIIGPCASFINKTSPLIYIDLPINEFHYRMSTEIFSSYFKLKYEVFNKLKEELIPRINFFIDGQRPNCPTWIDGDTFRQTLIHIRSLNEQLLKNGIILSDINNHLLEFSSNIFYNLQLNNS